MGWDASQQNSWIQAHIFKKYSVKGNPPPLESQKMQQNEEFKPKELQKGIFIVWLKYLKR